MLNHYRSATEVWPLAMGRLGGSRLPDADRSLQKRGDARYEDGATHQLGEEKRVAVRTEERIDDEDGGDTSAHARERLLQADDSASGIVALSRVITRTAHVER